MPLYLYFVVLTNLFFLKLQILTAHLLDQLFFHLIKLRGKIHVNLLRVGESSGLIPESALLLLADCAKLHDGWRCVDTFSFFNNWNQKFTNLIGTTQDLGLLPGVNRVKYYHSFIWVQLLVSKTDQISFNLACGLAVNTIYCLISRVCSQKA